MTVYTYFIGIDIGKEQFVVACHHHKIVKTYDNTSSGIALFLQEFKDDLPKSLCVLETTGGYEMLLLFTLCKYDYNVHRANTRKVKNFIRSFGDKAKTDALDAKHLALYGFERSAHLSCFVPGSSVAIQLFHLGQRRQDLKSMLVQEKNRSKSPHDCLMVKKSCASMIVTLEAQINEITAEINDLISNDPVLSEKKKILKGIPGIGDVVANNLLSFLPELGTLNRKEIAALAGVAPKANESGKFVGYRSTGHGRAHIKPILFVSAMAARNSHSPLKMYYEQLIGRGKKKMVALTALMRKIIVIANARIKEYLGGIAQRT